MIINTGAEFVFILLTIAAYVIGVFVYRKSKLMLLHSVIVATAIVILFFEVTGIDMDHYENNTKVLRYILNLSVVAFGYLLYKNYGIIRKNGIAILLATFSGSLVSLLSVAAIASIAGADLSMIITLLPKSITTPIAIVLTEKMGGIVYLTAVIVTLAGIFGAIIGPWFLRLVGIKGRLATGLAMGSAAHGIGTAKALESGALEGAAGGLAIALMGVFTSILLPLIAALLKLVL
ncbi:Inner membrane protein YohK [bioreactor metagenome]|uniref:Inner membrane protein YohK n=1 Tax=bioreactor metagenome TaxID=1076179 RepID=A0A644YKX8_9ZZZZ|nr:LrgB family protein [Rikenellaceae bacterium]